MTPCALLLALPLALADEPVVAEPAPEAPAEPVAAEPAEPAEPAAAEPAPEAPADAPADGAWVAPPPPPDDGGGFSFSDGAATTPTDGAATDAGGMVLQEGAADAKPTKVSFSFGGYVQYDLRFRPQAQDYGTYYQDVPSPPTLARNELMLKIRGGAKMGKYGMKADVDFAVRAYPTAKKLEDLSTYNMVTPFRFEIHDLYLYGRDVFGAKGLDLRIGQQKAMFGVGDQFNPTNTINANDLEDILLFGDQLGNLMVRADYSPVWNLTFTGILVPVFKPALLPSTGYLAQTPDRFPFVSDALRWNLNAEQALATSFFPGTSYPTIVRDVSLQLPDLSVQNMQGFARVAASLGGQDIALSYYNGRSDIPQPIQNTTSQVSAPACEDGSDPSNPTPGVACVDGVLASDVILAYPKMQVLGFNMTGEMNPFGKIHRSFKSIGYRLEVAVIFPEEMRLKIFQDNITLGPRTVNGEYPYPDGNNIVVEKRPFAKWTLGLDYQFNRFLYMNTQWVHGMVDEFGAGDWIQPGYQVRASGIRSDLDVLGSCIDLGSFSGKGETCAEEWLKPKLGDYLVWGTDVRFAAQRGLLRVFTLWDLIGVYKSTYDADAGERTLTHYGMFTKEGFSAVVYPQLSWNFGMGLELQAGALVQLGQRWSKFGAPETGGHQIWLRGRYSF